MPVPFAPIEHPQPSLSAGPAGGCDETKSGPPFPGENADSATPLPVMVARGNIYLSREVVDACLGGIDSVALLDRNGRVMVVPLTRESGGGLLLKIRNARGDRVIHAQEFFREKGYLEDFQERHFAARWDRSSAALLIEDMPKGQPG